MKTESDYRKTAAEAIRFNVILNQAVTKNSLWLHRGIVRNINLWVYSTYFHNFEWVYSVPRSTILKSVGARAPIEPTLTTPLQHLFTPNSGNGFSLSAVNVKLYFTSISAIVVFGCYYTVAKFYSKVPFPVVAMNL